MGGTHLQNSLPNGHARLAPKDPTRRFGHVVESVGPNEGFQGIIPCPTDEVHGGRFWYGTCCGASVQDIHATISQTPSKSLSHLLGISHLTLHEALGHHPLPLLPGEVAACSRRLMACLCEQVPEAFSSRYLSLSHLTPATIASFWSGPICPEILACKSRMCLSFSQDTVFTFQYI